MILLVSIIFGIFFVMIITYRQLSGSSVRFLCGTFVGWCAAVFGLLLFLSKQSYYWGAVNRIFYITPFVWNYLLKNISLDSDFFIRIMNIGAVCFYCSALCFSVAFTRRSHRRGCRIIYGAAAGVALLQVILFDPGIQKWMQGEVSRGYFIDFEQFNTLFYYIRLICSNLNLLISLLSLGMMVHYYWSYPKIRFLKRYTLFHMVCVFPVIIMFAYTFRWFPAILVRITMKPGYYNYLIPDLNVGLLNSHWFYVLLSMAYAALLIYSYKYHAIENYRKKDSENIKISMDTASIGINTFTHAIKNHIQGIKSECQYMSSLYPDDKELGDSVRCILESCSFCFSSIENANKQLKKVDLKLTLVPVNRVVKEVLEQVRSLQEQTNLVYEEVSEELMAYMDVVSMKEVLINLITNAKEAIAADENGQIRLSVQARERWIILTVEDNGTGIEEENIGKVFTPFFSTKSNMNNWGIGLTYCYQVVAAHDGRITVDSVRGQGSCFSIMLPMG